VFKKQQQQTHNIAPYNYKYLFLNKQKPFMFDRLQSKMKSHLSELYVLLKYCH